MDEGCEKDRNLNNNTIMSLMQHCRLLVILDGFLRLKSAILLSNRRA